METMYQRGKIQEESLYYETMKHNGELPIIGVNTFLSSEGSPTVTPNQVIRANTAEKEEQIAALEGLKAAQAPLSGYPEFTAITRQIQTTALQNDNLFATLMEATKWCSLGQITQVLYEVGGQYRRNM